MKRVSVIGTYHEERGLANAGELLAILERLKPEVIYLEMPPAAADDYLLGRRSNLESVTVRHYREQHPVELVPVDLPTPDEDFFANYTHLQKTVDGISSDYRRLTMSLRRNVAVYGFPYLNSRYATELYSELHEVTVVALAKLANQKLSESYELWLSANRARDRAMMTTIEEHLGSSACASAVFLVGAAHRQSLMHLSNRAALDVVWDFVGEPDAPQRQQGEQPGPAPQVLRGAV
jgi:hypothetical protein